MSPHHQEALGHLLYGTGEDGGFVQLTGEVGTGKTTLIRTLLEQQLADVDVALTLNPRLTVHEFLASVCDELQVEYPADSDTLKPLIDALNAHLLRSHAEGRRTVLIIDEAQNLSRDVLEQVRLLTNLETNRDKLLRIMLVGQPELRDMLARDDLRQLAQRITARYHLGSLTRKQSDAYVAHRLQVAGGHGEIFVPGALAELQRLSRGIPRLINVICDRALMGAYSQNLRQVDRKTLKRAANEVLEGSAFSENTGDLRQWMWLLAVATSIAAGVALYVWRPFLPVIAPPTAAAVPESVTVEPRIEELPAPAPGWAVFEPNNRQPMQLLLTQWGQALDTNDAAGDCRQAAAVGLRCLSGQGDWDTLRIYDLPAIISVTDDAGNVGRVVISSITFNTATLEMPTGEQSFSLSEVGERWTGEYLLLWQPPYPIKAIGPDSAQAHIRWLQQRLDMYEGRKTAVSLPYTYDSVLADRVRKFQESADLLADGLVGERTLIRLNQLAPIPGTPALARSSGGVH